MSFTILSSYSFIGHYIFRPNQTPSDVQVVMFKKSAAHCNAVLLPQIFVASGYLVMRVTISLYSRFFKSPKSSVCKLFD
jgi:hypothetical protein